MYVPATLDRFDLGGRQLAVTERGGIAYGGYFTPPGSRRGDSTCCGLGDLNFEEIPEIVSVVPAAAPVETGPAVEQRVNDTLVKTVAGLAVFGFAVMFLSGPRSKDAPQKKRRRRRRSRTMRDTDRFIADRKRKREAYLGGRISAQEFVA